MLDWAVGLSTGCFYKKSIFDTLPRIREYGFWTIEISTARSHLDYHDHAAVRAASELVEKLGLEPYSVHAPFSREIDISSPDTERRRHSLNEITHAVNAAAAFNVRYFVIHPGSDVESDRIGEEERQARKYHTVLSLNEIARHGRKYGVILVLENSFPHHLFGNGADLLWLLGSLENPYPRVCFDTGHAFLTHRQFDLLHRLAPYLAYIHAADNRGTGDDHLPPGKGGIVWHRLLYHLYKTGFNGTMILELAGGDETRPDSLVLEEAAQARRFLRRMAQTIYSSLYLHTEIPFTSDLEILMNRPGFDLPDVKKE